MFKAFNLDWPNVLNRNNFHLSESGVKTHQLSQFSLLAMAKKKRESGGSGRRPVSKATKKDEKRKSKGKETSKKKNPLPVVPASQSLQLMMPKFKWLMPLVLHLGCFLFVLCIVVFAPSFGFHSFLGMVHGCWVFDFSNQSRIALSIRSRIHVQDLLPT